MVDIAHVGYKIAIEVDGKSHGLKRQQQIDRFKEKTLSNLGWIVLRFSNERVMEHLEECVLEVSSTISR